MPAKKIKPKVVQCCANCKSWKENEHFKFLTNTCTDDRVKFLNTKPDHYCLFHELKTK